MSAYDGANRLTSITDPLGHQTTSVYDRASNLTARTDAENRTTAFAFDALDRRVVHTVAQGTSDEASQQFGYDPSGNLTGVLDFKGQLSTFEHDPLSRETRRTFDAPSVPTGDDLTEIATAYDPNGNALQVLERYTDLATGAPGPTGDLEILQAFDDFDRLISRTDAYGETLTHSYDASGNRTRLVDPDGLLTRYAYDALDRLVAVTTSGHSSGVTQYSYGRDSRLERVVHPNAAEETTTYDLAGRIAEIENTLGPALISSYAYTYDPGGNRLSQTEDQGAGPELTTYAYDPADRLIEVTYPDQRVAYQLDAVGNRVEESTFDLSGVLTGRLASTFDHRDRLLRIDDLVDPSASGQTTTFSWDLNGNQTGRTRGGVARVQEFDARDRLREIREDSTALLLTLRYDHRGLRTRKSGPEGVVRYTYDQDSVLLQSDDSENRS
ncbi:MAG: RHS repeat protein [Acidobacteria bacterium]|nr:MAG: RHS repeat protein [Acidobacteriota bacterium]REK10068.1 MAG: RHS repeat protein [Acidobacteriota bacterium]